MARKPARKTAKKRSRKRNQKKYPPGSSNAINLELAVDDIWKNKITVRAAAKKYKLPRSTIHDRYLKKYPIGNHECVSAVAPADNVQASIGTVYVTSDANEMVQSVRSDSNEEPDGDVFNLISAMEEVHIDDILVTDLGPLNMFNENVASGLALDTGSSTDFIRSLFEEICLNGGDSMSDGEIICLEAFDEQQIPECYSPQNNDSDIVQETSDLQAYISAMELNEE